MKFTLELQDAIKATLENAVVLDDKSNLVQEGTTEVYADELIPLLLQLAGGTQKLFWVMVEARDEWNQVHKSRKAMGSISMRSYHKTNFSTDINRLIKLEMVSMIGCVPTISPFLVLPKNTTQMQGAIQEVWKELICNGNITRH